MVSFYLNSIVEQYNITAKLGTFFMSQPEYTKLILYYGTV